MICETDDPALFPEQKIPRSTVRSWILLEAGRHLGTRPVKTTVVTDLGDGDAVVIDLAAAWGLCRVRKKAFGRSPERGSISSAPEPGVGPDEMKGLEALRQQTLACCGRFQAWRS